MFSNKINYKLLNITFLMLLLYIGFSNIELWYSVVVKIISLLGPFIIGFAFSYALSPIVNKLQDKGIRKSLAVVIVILGVILIAGSLLAMTLPMIYDQLVLFAKMVIEFLQNMGNKFDINLGSFEIKITDYLNDIIKSIGTLASTTTFDLISKSVDFISKFIVGFVAFIYFLADMDKIRQSFKEILLSINKRLCKYIKVLDQEIGQYIKGLAIFMFIQLIEYSLLFFVVGHPNWLILGILACITTIIPYFGGLITNIIAILTASVVSTPLFISTIVICLIFPQLDGYLISPKVYGKTNNVSPLITIMAVSVGGTLAGVVGIVIALPVYLLIRSTFQFFQNDLKKSMKKMKKVI